LFKRFACDVKLPGPERGDRSDRESAESERDFIVRAAGVEDDEGDLVACGVTRTSRLFDAGGTELDRLIFLMELLQGTRIRSEFDWNGP
jgi:hypothetical protein